jgi:hypothetical protein
MPVAFSLVSGDSTRIRLNIYSYFIETRASKPILPSVLRRSQKLIMEVRTCNIFVQVGLFVFERSVFRPYGHFG